MSLGALVSRLVGVALILFGGWLLFQGQPPMVVAIVEGMGVAFFVSARLSR